METIAIYWEPTIKTYGIVERTGLRLVSLALSTLKVDALVLEYLEQAKSWDDVYMVFASPEGDDGSIRLHLLFDGALPPPTDNGQVPPVAQVEEPVDLICLHGPHFGDRYGIADAALQALNTGNIPLRAMACAGASVYLVVPEGTAQTAGRALSEAFVVPSTTETES